MGVRIQKGYVRARLFCGSYYRKISCVFHRSQLLGLFWVVNDLLDVSNSTQFLLFADDKSIFCSYRDLNQLTSYSITQPLVNVYNELRKIVI